MRTTITLDDETAAVATQYADSRHLSLSRAIAELIVRGTRQGPRIKQVNGIPRFDIPKSRKPVTLEHIKELEEEW